MAAPVQMPWSRPRLPRSVIAASAAVGFLLLLWLGLTAPRPSVPEAPRPGVAEAAAARDFLAALRRARGEGPGFAALSVPVADLPRLAAIAGHAAGVPRLAAEAEEGVLRLGASFPAGAGRWLNLRAATRGAEVGVPEVRAAVGPLVIPPGLVRAGAEVLRLALWPFGLRLPPLGEMIGGLHIGGEAVVARIRLPSGTGAVGTLASARAAPVSPAEVQRAYCRLAAERRARPDPALETLVQRAFAAPAGRPVEANRAAFVALGMLAVGPRVGELAGLAPEAVAGCAPPDGPLLLAGRPDLAKHWALSAALAATLGEPLSVDLGQWKELADSAGGTGFSFVDIAANRSGIAWARRASDPKTAAEARRSLAAAGRAQLFPLELLAEAEGLASADFERRYGALESPAFRAVVARIDRHLARAMRGDA